MVKSATTNEKLPLISRSEINDNIPLTEKKFYGNGIEVIKNRGASVIWKNLRVTADIKKQHTFRNATHIYKEIIHNVSGFVKPSSLVAILGASGSGKSTLMSVLANRQPVNLKVDGDVRVNGRKIQLKLMRQISGFVYQDDLFIPTLTVLEHLHLAAQLKLDKKISAEYRRKLVNELLSDVGLTKCTNSFIGSTSFGRGKVNLSGGEQKRLSVATELLTDPLLLFCDEPTTGLDSFTALKLVTVMRNMTSQRGKTIICSIHQPSPRIFELFHQIILLYNGKIAFSGTTKDALEFFQSIGYPYKEEQNPADYLVKSLAIVPGQELETANKASNICSEFEKSQYATEMYDRIEEESRKKAQDFSVPEKIERISWFHMLYLMIYRDILGTIRDPSIQNMRIINKMILATILGVCMMGTTTMTQEGIQSLKGALFTMVAENFFPPLYGVIDHFPNKMPVFVREYTNNINTPLIFYLSSVISLTPGYMLDPFFFAVIMYVLIGLRSSWYAFIWTIIINALVINTSAAFGMLLSLSTGSVSMARIVATPIDSIYMILAGIFINLRSIPWILSWIRYISWMTFSTEALLILQLDKVDEIACSELANVPCLRNGEEALKSLDFDASHFNTDIVMICVLYLVIHVLSYLSMRIKLYFRTKINR